MLWADGWKEVVVRDVLPWGGVHVDRVDGRFTNEPMLPDKLLPLGPPPASHAAVPCTTDPGVADPAAAHGGLQAGIKHAVYANYVATETGSVTARGAIGVTFQSLQVGDPIPNRATAWGYHYSNTKHDAPVYPASTRHVFCRASTRSTTRTFYAGRYACFQDRADDAWVCGTDAGHRAIRTEEN